MKACAQCERVHIGRRYKKLYSWRVFIGLPLIYLPILFLPFIMLSGLLSYLHLRMMGAKDVRSLPSFLPEKQSFRYHWSDQIVRRNPPSLALWARTRLFWIFNCTWYCPFSVAVLDWHAYLVKVVENFWCPFAHSRKENYAIAAVDQSYWHLNPQDRAQLHFEDRENPIWNEAAQLPTRRPVEPVSAERKIA